MKMERKVQYIIEEELAIAIKKITGKLKDTEMKVYGLTGEEIVLVHEYYDLVLENGEMKL
jgi:hypothetical protein